MKIKNQFIVKIDEKSNGILYEMENGSFYLMFKKTSYSFIENKCEECLEKIPTTYAIELLSKDL